MLPYKENLTEHRNRRKNVAGEYIYKNRTTQTVACSRRVNFCKKKKKNAAN